MANQGVFEKIFGGAERHGLDVALAVDCKNGFTDNAMNINGIFKSLDNTVITKR
jgi:hypothetical protein